MSISRQRIAQAAISKTASGAQAAEMGTAKRGMKVHICDRDKGGVSGCEDDCAKKWPPYLGKAEDALTEGWTLAKRTDDTMQWAYDGKPVYFFAKDAAKGDAKGDGLGGIWHVIKE